MPPRSRSVEGSERVPGYVPKDVMRQVRLLLLDPVTGKIEYGAFSNLITSLLVEWIEKQRKGVETVGAEAPPKDRFESFTNEGE